MSGACSTHGSNDKCIQYFYCKNLKGRDHSVDLGVDGKVILGQILWKDCRKVWNGFIWLRTGTSCEVL